MDARPKKNIRNIESTIQNAGFHDNCFACGKNGLNLKFEAVENGSVCSAAVIDKCFQGYEGIVHGGITASILDCGMVQLFYITMQLRLKTARISVRYRKPVPVEKRLDINAFYTGYVHGFYTAKAEIKIDGLIYAEAEGFFKA